MLRIPFQLQKPYISKDERDFYLLDNPLRREKVFQVPMIAATSWKGALRAALWQLGYPETNEVTIRLLGNPHGSEEGQAGRLYFYSTFFKEIGLEVINPHSRETGVGERGPILMECIPKGSGTLVLLYVPFGPIEQEESKRCVEVAQDLKVLAQGIQVMLTTYGFGAKTSSGFGTAKDQLSSKGTLAFRGDLPGIAVPAAAIPELEQPAPNLAGYLESLTRLHEDFRQPDGSPKSEADYKALLVSRGQQYTKKRRRDYERVQKWWEREGRRLAEAATQEPPEPEAAPTSAATPSVSEWPFDSLSELRVLAERVAARLRDGDRA